MLEGLATRLFGKVIDQYIKNFDPKQLQIALYNGEVNMTNLEIKKEALDTLHLPINVVEGHISKLTAYIPYQNLRGSPTRIDIEDVFLLVAPKSADEYNEEEDRKRAQVLKIQNLEKAELLKDQNTEGRSQEEQQKHQSFVEGVIALVVDNLQISVKNIHIRYEDSVAVPGHPFSIGLKLPLLSAVSTDEHWTPTFIKASEKTSRKLVKLTSLSVYWNTDSELFGEGMTSREGSEPKRSDHAELMAKFREGLEKGENYQYMLRPISGRAGVTLDRSGKIENPKTKARLIFNELAFVLDDHQYRDTLMLLDFFHYFTRHHEYKKYRPEKTPKEDPQAWLRFAGQAVLRKIQERNRRWTWEYMRERRDERKEYIDLFKKKQKGENPSPAEQTRLTALEEKLSYEDLRFWRSLARTQLRKENVGVKKPEPKKTWTQWVWGSKKPEDAKVDDQPVMTEEEKQEVYKMIDFDEKRALSESFDLPREAIKLQVESSLETGSFTLKRKPHDESPTDILSLNFDDFDAKFLQRPDSVLLDLKLGGLRAYDGCTKGSLFPQIVQVKDAIAPNVGAGEDLDERLVKGIHESTKDPLLHLVAEQHPLDDSADSKVDFKLKEIEVIYNPQFVVEVYKFFKPPERHMDSIAALMETAGAAVEGIRKQTRAGLEYALEEHKTVAAHLDIQAPLIIIPESITKESALCLIVDAGHVSMNSKLIDKETMKEIQAKQKSKYSEEDYRRLESLMYDKFLLELDSTQVLLGPGIEATKAQLKAGNESMNYHIMDRINMSFVLETSIIPKATDITKTRISGHLPILHASMSDKKYKNLMRLINSTLPKFDDEPEGKKSVEKGTERGPGESSASTRPRSKSVQLLEARQEVIIDDDASVKDEAPLTPAVNLHQRNLELKFTIDKLQGSLYREDPDGKKPDQLLVELVAEHFVFDFYLRPFDMVAEVLLKSLNVDDHIEENPSPEFKRIISSDESSSEQNNELFKVKFVKVQKDSPEFITTYEGIVTHLEATMSTINLIVTRKTLLTLLDFVLDTFTSPNESPPKEANKQATKELETQAVTEPDKIRIKADLNSIALILNSDGIRLATLSFQKAEVGISLSGNTMKVAARLGSLSLTDDINQGASPDDSLRQLVTIQGDELADFRYQIYDEKDDSYPGYDTNVTLRSGSIKVNFLEEPFRKIIDFLVKFGKMQAIFNAARQAAANQANRVQENASKLHFDIVVKTPIIVFPRVMVPGKQRDVLTAYLGEIYAKNRFAMVKGGKKMAQANKITAGIRNVRLTSNFHYEDDVSEELEMIDKVDLDFKVEYVEHEEGTPRPDLSIDGTVSPIKIHVAQTQLKFLMELSKAVPAAFSTDADEKEDEVLEELPASKTEPAKKLSSRTEIGEDRAVEADQRPELSTSPEIWTKLDVKFRAETIGLELILAKEDQPVGDIKDASLSTFAINSTDLKLRMLTNGSLESELLVRSFTITDSRKSEANKFRKVMSLINDNVKHQFMVSVSMSGGEEKNLIAIVTIDSPRIIFAMDYIFALQAFANTAFATEKPLQVQDAPGEGNAISDDPDTPMSPMSPEEKPIVKTKEPESSGMSISYTVTVEDAQVMLIANPAIANSEAIVLGTQRVLVASQNSLVVSVTKLGMFLCRMDRFETSRLRVLDDFTLNLSMNTRSQGENSTLTNINLDIEPLVLRLSLRDILLAYQIVTKASEMTNTREPKLEDSEPQKIKDVKADSVTIKRNAPTGKSSRRKSKPGSKVSTIPKPKPRTITVMTREEMTATIQGIRVVLISNLHELPLLDWSVKKFHVDVRDWSGAMTGDTSFDTYMNVFNFSKSAWEPLIEPWQLGFHLSKEQKPECLTVDVYSTKSMDLTLTSATITLGLKSAQFFSTDEDVLSKPRGTDAPFRVRNYTGFPLSVWAANNEDSGSAAKMNDGEEIPWRFEDSTTMREQLSPDSNSGIVGIRLEGSGFEAITRIPVNREGETLYNLKPRQDKILHRLLVDVKLESDNVKYITFRSPLLVENKTQITIELGVYDPESRDLLKIERIPPGLSRPAPVGAAFLKALILRPEGFEFDWSQKHHLYWKDLLKLPTRTISCRDQTSDSAPPFFFQVSASFDKNHPLTGVYPYMKINVFAPIEIQNLLPYDVNYRVHDKTTGKNYSSFLRKGGVYPVYTVELSHLILLQITMQDTPYRPSEWSIINSSPRDRSDFPRDRLLSLKDNRGLQLNLKLQYFNTPDSGGAFRVAIYSPYVILDKTGLGLNFQSKASFSSAKLAAGQSFRAESGDDSHKARPYMFSHPSDNKKNRALVKVDGYSWGEPVSFDAIGSPYDVVLPSTTQNTEIHVGVSISAGEGEYKLTKVVTVTPRFILKNKIAEKLNVREPGSSEIMTVEQGGLLPLRSLRRQQEKQLCLCFPGINNQWSNPFAIDSVGTVYVKLAKAGQRQQLIKVNIILEGATIFLHLSYEKEHWPFKMRNESEVEFLFYQANPNIREDEEDRGSGWKPIRYRLPPRSIMQYSWDFPAAKFKELVLTALGKERHIKLAEIGNLIPMRLGQQKVVDLNIVAEGTTQILLISNYKPGTSMYKQKSASGSQSSVASGFEVKEQDSDVTLRTKLRLEGIGLSLVNRQLKELLYLTLRDLDFKYTESKLYQTVSATIKWIQIDNQLYGGIFPIVLYPSVVPRTGKEMEAHPILQAAVTRVKDNSYGVVYIKYATLLLQQLTVEIDEDFIYALMDFTKVPGPTSEEHGSHLGDESLDIPEPQKEEQGQELYFELLHLQPIQLDVSFVRTERINAEDTVQQSSNPLGLILDIMTMSIGNVNDAPLKFNALMLENARVSFPMLYDTMYHHYLQESMRQVHVIVGSADFLGNPVGLFNNITSGVADIFYEPYMGIVNDRPQEMGIGLAKGASSFVKKSVFGFSDSMAKWTGSMSKGLAVATMDKEFQDKRRMSKARNRPKHALYGITSGGNAFATSMASGIGGLARHPFEGAEKEGFQGFVKGVGKGVLGLATKPAIGAFDLASNVAEGVRNTTTVFDQEGLDRVRLTRFIGIDGIIRPYSQREALGQFWLKTLEDGTYFHDEYIAHMELSGGDGRIVVLTYNRILTFKSKKMTVEFDYELSKIQTITKERTGMMVYLKDGVQGCFLPVQDEASRNWLYKQIAIAVNAYNEKHSAR